MRRVGRDETMMAVAGILFDKDGTLVDFNRTWLSPYRRAAAYLHGRYGEAATPARLLADGGFINETETWRADSVLASGHSGEILRCWETSIGQRLGDAERRELAAIFVLPPNEYVAVADDLPALFAELRGEGITLGLATMDSEANAHCLLRALGVEDEFAFVCGADSGYGVKPQAGMVLAFGEACGLRCGEVMMVGDSPRDLKMGRNAGVGYTVGVLTGAHGAADLALDADFVLGSIAELPGLLRAG